MKKKTITFIISIILSLILAFYSGGKLSDDNVIYKELVTTEKVMVPACTVKIPINNIIVKRETLQVSSSDSVLKNWMDSVGLKKESIDYYTYTTFKDIKPDEIKEFQGAKIWSKSAFTMINDSGELKIHPVPKLNTITLEAYPPKYILEKYPLWKKTLIFSAGICVGYASYKIIKN